MSRLLNCTGHQYFQYFYYSGFSDKITVGVILHAYLIVAPKRLMRIKS